MMHLYVGAIVGKSILIKLACTFDRMECIYFIM